MVTQTEYGEPVWMTMMIIFISSAVERGPPMIRSGEAAGASRALTAGGGVAFPSGPFVSGKMEY